MKFQAFSCTKSFLQYLSAPPDTYFMTAKDFATFYNGKKKGKMSNVNWS